MKIIGIIGGSGSGKSRVAGLLGEYGFKHIDGDVLARRVTEPGQPCLAELSAAFGADILTEDGALDRKKLAAKAFIDKESTQRLNKITHKYILRLLEEEIAACGRAPGATIDGAALVESGFIDRCDAVIAVTAPFRQRLRRIMVRDGITRAQALERIGAQKPDEFYISHADYLIGNRVGVRALKRKVGRVAAGILSNGDKHGKG